MESTFKFGANYFVICGGGLFIQDPFGDTKAKMVLNHVIGQCYLTYTTSAESTGRVGTWLWTTNHDSVICNFSDDKHLGHIKVDVVIQTHIVFLPHTYSCSDVAPGTLFTMKTHSSIR